MATSCVCTSSDSSFDGGLRRFDSQRPRTGLVIVLICAVAVLYGSGQAEATPTMEVTVSRSVDDYWPDNDGMESYWEITVRNVSDPNVANNMIDLTYVSGPWIDPTPDVGEGVFYVFDTPGWAASSLGNRTVFSGLLEPQSIVTFRLYSTELGISQAYATATATGEGVDVPFSPVLVDVPAPEPASLVLLAAGFLPLLRRKPQTLG